MRHKNPIDQVGFAIVHHVITEDERISDGEFRLYCLLLKYAQQDERCWPSVETLAEKLRCSVSSVCRHIAHLLEVGYIERKPRGAGSTITLILDIRQDDELVRRADAELGRRGMSKMTSSPRGGMSKMTSSPAGGMSKMTRKEEPATVEKEPHAGATVASPQLLVRGVASHVVHSDRGLQIEEHAPPSVRAVDVSAAEDHFSCPDCGATVEWSRKRGERRKLRKTCAECGLVMCVRVVDAETGDLVEEHKPKVAPRRVAVFYSPDGAELARFPGQRIDVAALIDLWRDHREIVLEKLAWVLSQEWMRWDRARHLPTLLQACRTSLASAAAAPPAIAPPESEFDPDKDEWYVRYGQNWGCPPRIVYDILHQASETHVPPLELLARWKAEHGEPKTDPVA